MNTQQLDLKLRRTFMAHLVETMAFVGQTPWHGLGNQLTPNQPLEVWAEQAGMDWRIESSDVSYMAQNHRGQSIIMPFEEQRFYIDPILIGGESTLSGSATDGNPTLLQRPD
jgi:hypothetical protein